MSRPFRVQMKGKTEVIGCNYQLLGDGKVLTEGSWDWCDKYSQEHSMYHDNVMYEIVRMK